MTYIVHALSTSDWERFKDDGEYRPESLEKQGFIHCSKVGQIGVVADSIHSDDDDMMLLLIDESCLNSPVQYETNGDSGTSAFPHIYGPLTLDEVAESFQFMQDETGYRLPNELLSY